MADTNDLRQALEDLVEIVRQHALETQKLLAHVEGQTVPVPQRSQLPLVLSELSELHGRVRKMAGKTVAR